MKKRPIILLMGLAAVFCLFGCTKKISLNDFELKPQQDGFSENNYAVVTDKYVTAFDIPGEMGINVTQLRHAEIYPVEETTIVQSDEGQLMWVKIAGGWVPETSVQLYTSFDKAATAAEKLQ